MKPMHAYVHFFVHWKHLEAQGTGRTEYGMIIEPKWSIQLQDRPAELYRSSIQIPTTNTMYLTGMDSVLLIKKDTTRVLFFHGSLRVHQETL